MKIGNIKGLIDGSMSVVYDSGVLTSNTASISITGLDGDTDEQYMIVFRLSMTNDSEHGIQLAKGSADWATGAGDYTWARHWGSSAAHGASNSAGDTLMQLDDSAPGAPRIYFGQIFLNVGRTTEKKRYD